MRIDIGNGRRGYVESRRQTENGLFVNTTHQHLEARWAERYRKLPNGSQTESNVDNQVTEGDGAGARSAIADAAPDEGRTSRHFTERVLDMSAV